jgi:tetratricopeptide (TPR) repeat protein
LCLALCALVSACASHRNLVANNLANAKSRELELVATPFFPQREFECGPAALAMVLGASGVEVAPDALTPLVYLPARRGSLQVEMEAAPRNFGRLAYPLSRNLDAIIAEVDAGRPVLVLHNYGIPRFPRYHYAVVVGYESVSDSIILRSGVTQRQVLSAANFMRAWDNGGRWALVVLRPGELPATANATTYLEAAAGFERKASPADARLAFDAAIQRWPNQPVAWVGRGTAEYRAGALPAAARDYEAALRLDDSNIGARNNLAMTWLELGCPSRAREQIEKVNDAELKSPLREAVLDTRQRLASATEKAGRPDSRVCAGTP